MRPGVEGLALLEGVEDSLPDVGRDARTLVGHANLDAVGAHGAGDLDGRAGRGEAQRVVDELLQEPSRDHGVEVGLGDVLVGRDVDAAVARRDLPGDLDHVDPFGQRRLRRQLEPLDEVRQGARSRREPLEQIPLLGDGHLVLGEGLGHPEDDRDGRPQLVAEPGDLLVAALRSLDQRLVGPLEFRGALALALEGLRQLVDHGGRDLRGR